jgi:hypothetical protein
MCGQVKRGSDSGLSIVIPYPNPDLDEAAMLRAVVKHYYFPILAGALVVEVGGTTVSSANISDVATMFNGLDLPIEFASAVQTQRSNSPQAVAINAIGTAGLTESDFSRETLTQLLSDFQNGAMIHVEAPIRLSSKGAAPRDLLASPKTSEPLEVEINVKQGPFRDRQEFGTYLIQILKPLDPVKLSTDRGLWTWLALYWFDLVCPPLAGGRNACHRSAADVLKRFIEQFVRLSAQFPQIHRTMTIEGNQSTARLQWIIDNYLRGHFGRVRDTIKRA